MTDRSADVGIQYDNVWAYLPGWQRIRQSWADEANTALLSDEYVLIASVSNEQRALVLAAAFHVFFADPRCTHYDEETKIMRFACAYPEHIHGGHRGQELMMKIGRVVCAMGGRIEAVILERQDPATNPA